MTIGYTELCYVIPPPTNNSFIVLGYNMEVGSNIIPITWTCLGISSVTDGPPAKGCYPREQNSEF